MEQEIRFWLIKVFMVGLVGMIAIFGFIMTGTNLLFIFLLVGVVVAVNIYKSFGSMKDTH